MATNSTPTAEGTFVFSHSNETAITILVFPPLMALFGWFCAAPDEAIFYYIGAVFFLLLFAILAEKSTFSFDSTSGRVIGTHWKAPRKYSYALDLQDIHAVAVEDYGSDGQRIILKTRHADIALFANSIPGAGVKQHATKLSQWLRQHGYAIQAPTEAPEKRQDCVRRYA
jgi:hypothetical protein